MRALKNTKSKLGKKRKILYSNKVFSYSNRLLENRNYSRKDFGNTVNCSVSFRKCKFEQTIFKYAKFENCLFEDCQFSKFDFLNILFKDVTFKNCIFNNILFNKCIFIDSKFDDSKFNLTCIFPNKDNIQGFNSINEIIDCNENEIRDVLDKAILHKQIRESNTLFKKFRNSWPKDIKRDLKHIKKKEGDSLGLTKKQRLEENARRKKLRNKLQRQNYQDSLLGKNRKIDKVIVKYLLVLYTDEEFKIGMEYAMEKIKFSFSSLSFLIKYIDEGILNANKQKDVYGEV